MESDVKKKDNWKDMFPCDNRYFETDNGILYCGDCLDIMKSIPKGVIDIVLTDPPYNIAESGKLTKSGNAIKTTNEAWGSDFKDSWNTMEEYLEWLMDGVNLINNTLKDSGSFIAFLDRAYTGLFVYEIEKRMKWKFRNKIYFEKHNPVPNFRKKNYRSCIEEAIWFTKSHNGNYYLNFISQEEMKQVFKGSIGKKVTSHPTEKYEWMIVPLVERHSKTCDLILDPFAGSGTVLNVAEKLNRYWIGVEKKAEYCETIVKRLKFTSKMRPLFAFGGLR